MLSVDLATRVSERVSARPVEDLPQWRDRLVELWRLQVAEIIELSLAYHQAAAARPPRRPDPADRRARQLWRILARTASAYHALAEIEAAIGRIDTGSYGICEHCGLPVEAGWLDACPRARYCRIATRSQAGRSRPRAQPGQGRRCQPRTATLARPGPAGKDPGTREGATAVKTMRT